MKKNDRAHRQCDDKTIKIWKISTGEAVMSLSGHTGWVRTLSVTPDGAFIVSGIHDNTINVWSTEFEN